MVDLSPCPHCGDRGVLHVIRYGSGVYAAYVDCIGCHARTAIHLTGDTGSHNSGPDCAMFERRATIEDARASAVKDWEARVYA